jgi:hypothetical protein
LKGCALIIFQNWYFPNEEDAYALNKTCAGNVGVNVPEIPLKYSEGKKTNIILFSDLHMGAKAFNTELFEKFLGLVEEMNAYVILVGDLWELAFPSRHEQAPLEEDLDAHEQYKLAEKYFMPLRDRVLFSTRGNHDARVWKKTGFDMARKFASDLGCFYNVNGGYLRVNVGTQTYTFSLFHGFSAAADPFRELQNRLATYDESDVMAMGNNHYLGVRRVVKKRIVDGVEVRHPVYLVRTGAFLSEPEYSREAQYAPTFEGCPIITLSGTKRNIVVDVDGEAKFD